MAGTRRLSIEVVGDTKGVSKAFSDVDADAGRMSSGMAGKIGKAGLVLGGFALAGGAAAIGIGSAVNSMGIEMETLRAKSQVVFGDSLGQVTKWADANAAAMGLTSLQATSLATNMADLLKPMGFTAEQAAVMSTEMTDLSGALSAWSGGTIDAAGVADIMTKAMLGETDGLKQLGISISAADVATRLAEKGQTALTGAALAQAEALAVQELILEKSTDAQTAWADGSMDAVKAANAQKASIQGIKESFVNALYPAIQRVIPLVAEATAWLGEKLPIAMAVVKAWTEENWPKIQAAIQPVLEWFQATGQEVVEFVAAAWAEHGDRIMTQVAATWEYIQEATAIVFEWYRSNGEAVIEFVANVWEQHGDRILTQVMNVWSFIQEAIKSAMQVIRGVIDVVLGAMSGDWGRAWDGIKGILGGVWDGMTNLVRYALQTMGLLLDMAWESFKGLTRSAWDGIKSLVASAVDGLVGYVTGIPGRIAGTVSGLWTDISDNFNTTKDAVKLGIDSVVEFATGLKGRMSGIFSGMWDGIKSAFGSVINSIIGVWNRLEFTVPGVSAFGQTIGGFTIGVPDIAPVRLHVGGQVGGMSFAGMGNDEVAAILQRGENVLTPGQTSALAGSGGNTYNLNVMATPGTNRVELGRELIELIRESERSNGTNWRSSLVPN